MKKTRYTPYVLLVCALLALFKLPTSFGKSMQSGLVTLFAKTSPIPIKQVPGLDTLVANYIANKDRFEANVIYRDPLSWSSTLFIDVGTKSGVKPNSPVLFEGNVIGVVETCFASKSLVRLITDSDLTPSVRSVRGKKQHESLLNALSHLKNLLTTQDGFDALLNELTRAENALFNEIDSNYLAKGEIHGISAPLWRKRTFLLEGVGFNCEYGDDLCKARDLRTGETYDKTGPKRDVLKTGDLLVTSGLDGVFPRDLPVALITKVHPLQAGDVSYSIEAYPTAGPLHNVDRVTVLPPLEKVPL